MAEVYFKQKAKESGGAGGLLVVTVDRATLAGAMMEAEGEGEAGERADVDTFVALEFGGAHQRTHVAYVSPNPNLKNNPNPDCAREKRGP